MNSHAKNFQRENLDRTVRELASYICEQQTDVVALQECGQTSEALELARGEIDSFASLDEEIIVREDNGAYLLSKALKALGESYYWTWRCVKQGYGKYDEGVAIFSRFPLEETESFTISKQDDYFNWKTRKSLGAKVRVNESAYWFYTVHMGWWKDEEEPFAPQMQKLQQYVEKKEETVFLMGDFNSAADIREEGYDFVASFGWQDTWHLAKEKDDGITVPGVIDGWESVEKKGMRIDYIWANVSLPVTSSKVIFSGEREPIISDHFGVAVEIADEKEKKKGQNEKNQNTKDENLKDQNSKDQDSERVMKIKEEKNMRASGILLSVSSLPSKYGIGCFSKEAYEFVDQLVEAGQKYWQILPLCPTGYGDSPYQSCSTFAGNPYFIDLDTLISYGWLTKEECDEVDFGSDLKSIDYGKLYEGRFDLLKIAYKRSQIEKEEDFKKFVEENKFWLPDYALYMAIKKENDERVWLDWESSLRFRDAEALEKKKKELKEEITFYEFMQYEFKREWTSLKEYANAKGIKIIGDIPIYVSLDSADAWTGRELFQFDEQGYPTAVAGCPPDGFSATGQLWGNPLYDWEYHKKTGYSWWIERLAYCYSMYDVVRIDHFRGFDEYYSIPYGDTDATRGHWEAGPGIGLFKAVEEVLPGKEIIAEDLGYVTDSVRKLVTDTGFPGMKVLEFAFDSRDSGSASDYLPHNYIANSVVYTGTHDNETVIGWFCGGLQDDERAAVRDYFCDYATPDNQMHIPLICGAMRSVSKLCVIPMQDILGYGNEARLNTPSTTGTNWKWRIGKDEFSSEVRKQFLDITKRYGR